MVQYGFSLKQWTSNCVEVLERVCSDNRVIEPRIFEDEHMNFVRVLGIRWDPVEDTFNYNVNLEHNVVTKRGVLSVIARIFDPIDLLAPVTFRAKMIMQRIWKINIAWDASLLTDILNDWTIFLSELPSLSTLAIPRYVMSNDTQEVHVCGFCDTSESGYVVVVYQRIVSSSGHIITHVLGSKSKVAPTKPITVPRLELCGALLSAQWMNHLTTTPSSKLTISKWREWTDSTIVLAWMANSPVHFKICVTNRVTKIKTLMPNCK